MLSSPTVGAVVGALGDEARHVWHDARTILRPIVRLLTSLEGERVLGLPLDRVLHVLVAAAIVLVAVRFMARWKAALVALVPIILKEALDVPAKLRILGDGHPVQISLDSMWDTVAGLLGIGAGVLIAGVLGRRWSARRPVAGPRRPRPRAPAVGPVVPRVVLAGLLAVSMAIVLGFGLTESIGGRSVLSWVPHAVAIALVLAAHARLGPANALIIVMAALPFANWLHRGLAAGKLNVGSTLILSVLACEIVRSLRDRPRRLSVGAAGWGVAAYSCYACLIVLVNCFRLGWTVDRAYSFISPMTGLAVYFLARQLLGDARLLRRALTAFAGAFVAIAAVAIVEFIVRPLQLEQVPGSVFGSAPRLGVYLSLVWPFVLALAFVQRWPAALYYWTCVILGAVTIGLVFNRSCWVAAGAAALVLLVLFLVRRDWVLALGSAAAIAVVLGTLAWGVQQARQSSARPFKSRIVREAASLLRPHIYDHARLRTIRKANEIIGRSPILGSTGASAHTLHQAHAINYGVPGTVLAAAAILAVLAGGWVGYVHSRDPVVFALAAGATACVIAAVLEGMGWPGLRRSSMQPLLWYILGLMSASAGAVRRGAATPE